MAFQKPVGRPPVATGVNEDLTFVRAVRRSTFSLNFEDEDWLRLARIALANNCMYGSRPSVSCLMRNIARGYLVVVPAAQLVNEGDLYAVTRDDSEDHIPD